MKLAFFTIPAALVSSVFAQNPDAAKIVEGARMAATLLQTDLTGSISKNGKRTPLNLYLRNQDIQFALELGGPTQRFHLRLGANDFNLYEIAPDGKTSKFPDNKLVQPIAGSDLSYEDLSLQFLYWPGATLQGEENVLTQPCYKIRINKPKGAGGQYEVVYVWIHKTQGAFLKVAGFDRAGVQLKEFVVEEVMSIGKGVYSLAKMKVSSFKDGRVSGTTYLLFDKPKSATTPGKR